MDKWTAKVIKLRKLKKRLKEDMNVYGSDCEALGS